MAKNFNNLTAAEQYQVVMTFLYTQFGTSYWRGVSKLTPNTRFHQDLELTCLDEAMFLHDAEEEFGVVLSEDDLVEIETFDDFAKKIIQTN